MIKQLQGYTGIQSGDIQSGAIFSPNGEFLAASSTNGTVSLWNVADPAKSFPIGTFRSYTGDWVMGEVYSPNGRILATANRPDAAVLWNVSDPAQPWQSIVIHILTGKVRGVERSPSLQTEDGWLSQAITDSEQMERPYKE